MPRTRNIINIPKPAPGSFNKNRPAGKLLQAQLMHLREGLIQHLAKVVELLATDLTAIKTEGEVSAYAHKVTRILHPLGAKRPGS
jgi:hypothetical protein